MRLRPLARTTALLTTAGLLPLFSFISLAVEPQSAIHEPIRLGPRNKAEGWVKHEVNGIAYEVALEWLMGKESGWGSQRVIFVALEPNLLTRANVLAVFQDISSKIPQPTFLNVTLLADREAVKERVQKYIGLITSNDTIYTRLTGDSARWCPRGFLGAQFDRYTKRENYVLCTEENLEEIEKDKDAALRSRVIDRRLRRF